jgi:hypothetical protein
LTKGGWLAGKVMMFEEVRSRRFPFKPHRT